MPTYNRSAHLACTLASLEPALDIKGLQVLVLDNASNDNTAQLVAAYTSRYETVSYIRNPMNLSFEGNITRALTIPGSKYIWLLSDHMVVMPETVRSILPVLANSDAVVGYCGIQGYGSLSGFLPRTEPFPSFTLQEICQLIFWTSNISALIVKRDHVASRAREIFRFSGYSYPHLGIWSHLGDDSCNQVLLLPTCSRFQTPTDVPATLPAAYHFFRSRFIGFGRAVQATNLHVSGRRVVPGDFLSEVPLYRASIWGTLTADLLGTLPEDISINDIVQFAQLHGWRAWPFVVVTLFLLMFPMRMRSPIRWSRSFLRNIRRKGIGLALREYRAQCSIDKQIREKMRDATQPHRF